MFDKVFVGWGVREYEACKKQRFGRFGLILWALLDARPNTANTPLSATGSSHPERHQCSDSEAVPWEGGLPFPFLGRGPVALVLAPPANMPTLALLRMSDRRGWLVYFDACPLIPLPVTICDRSVSSFSQWLIVLVCSLDKHHFK